MKRIISLFLAALILLGTIASSIMMVAYADEDEAEDEKKPDGVYAGNGIYIESYDYNKSKETLTIVLVDANYDPEKLLPDEDSCQEFYAALMSSNFYPASAKDDKRGPSITDLSKEGIEILGWPGDENAPFPTIGLGFRVKFTFPEVAWDGEGNEIYFRYAYNFLGVDGDAEIKSGGTIRANLTQIKPLEKEEPQESKPETPKPEPATPYILLKGYDYGGADVPAGSDFDLALTLYNTSADLALENIVIKVTPSKGLSIIGASNTYYISGIGKQGTVVQSIPLKCLTSAVPGGESVAVSFSYEYVSNDTRKTLSSEETVSVPVAQADRFEVELTDVPTLMWPGERSTVMVNYVNKGRSELYNLTATISGNIEDPNQIHNLGNIAAGASGNAKFQLVSNEPGGLVDCVITLSYENAEGVITEVTKNLQCEVYDNSQDFVDVGIEEPMPAVVPEQTGMRWWQVALVAVGCLALGGFAGYWMFLKTKMKREYDDDFDDDDDDEEDDD